MIALIKKYTGWLHGQWPAGRVEPLPELNEAGATNIPGLYVIGDLKGIPLLKFAIDSGAKVIHAILKDKEFLGPARSTDPNLFDVVIIGGGVSGLSAGLEARKKGLSVIVVEANEPFSTIVNFPKGKPIFTYPENMKPAGDLHVTAQVKEPLLDELRAQVHKELKIKKGFAERVVSGKNSFEIVLKGEPSLYARRVIVAIGRTGNFRRLGIPGEDLDKVTNRLHDPHDFSGKKCLVVGGGDTAIETAIALNQAGADVILSYRKSEFSRAKPENIETIKKLANLPKEENSNQLRLAMSSLPVRITPQMVEFKNKNGDVETISNDAVFTMIGREAPLDFFRRSGVHISNEWNVRRVATLVFSLLVFTFIYHWKKTGLGGFQHLPILRDIAGIGEYFSQHQWFPYNITFNGGSGATPFSNIWRVTLREPGFYYSLAYCVLIVVFGLKRISRRKTPYIKLQTWTLATIQIIPLFLLPYIILPWMGYSGFFNEGVAKKMADALFPIVNYGHGREYWRAFGFVLAWPLFFWNVFTHQPLWTWLAISFVQTFIIIPGLVFFWGKGAYCGWICSCGALAETLGDDHRSKMPHGPKWNKLNMAGQVLLVFSFALLFLRILGWAHIGWAHIGWAEKTYLFLFHDMPLFNYVWFVDLFLAGIIGVGLYFHFSGRVWCRFFCPLAALMHIYARFSRFGILAEKKKCISCNVCTSVCHMGIDVMNFANKGLPMKDPECVRCSACVQSCPTGVLSFGQTDHTGKPLKSDTIAAR